MKFVKRRNYFYCLLIRANITRDAAQLGARSQNW